MSDLTFPGEVITGLRQLCEVPPNVQAYEKCCVAIGWEPSREENWGAECFEILLSNLFYRILVCFEGLDCYAATSIDFLDTSEFSPPEDGAITNEVEFDERFDTNLAAVERELGVPSFRGEYIASGLSEGRVFHSSGWTYGFGHLTLVQHHEGDIGAEATLDLRIVRVGEQEVPKLPLQTNILM